VRALPIANPPNPWSSTEVEYLEAPPETPLTVFEENGKTILSKNDSPDLGFRYSVNPYRGCVHGCAYCYARPTHQYWGFGAGTDFDRKIIVKVRAPEMLEAEISKRSWQHELILFSGNTDCYQPLEASYGLTRRLLQVCLEHRNPVWIITKSALVRRDADVIASLSKAASAGVSISIPFCDPEMARALEPYASSPDARFETIKRLTDRGIEVGVNVAPVIPGLSDPQIAEILERAHAAGARRASLIALRLPAEVLPVFVERLRAAYPDREKKVINAVLEMREGKMYQAGFGSRMRGAGPRWAMIEQLFDAHVRRLGMLSRDDEMSPSTPRAPAPSTDAARPAPARRQLRLFDDG
jgi:DNA repair photolyase